MPSKHFAYIIIIHLLDPTNIQNESTNNYDLAEKPTHHTHAPIYNSTDIMTWQHVLLKRKQQHVHVLITIKHNKSYGTTKASYIKQSIQTLHAHECRNSQLLTIPREHTIIMATSKHPTAPKDAIVMPCSNLTYFVHRPPTKKPYTRSYHILHQTYILQWKSCHWKADCKIPIAHQQHHNKRMECSPNHGLSCKI